MYRNFVVFKTLLKGFNCRNYPYRIFRRLEVTSIVKHKTEVQERLEKKVKFYMKIYEDLFGITKVTEMQEEVTTIQAKLQIIQEKRRKVQEEIFIVQRKLLEVQDVLHKTSIGDNTYLNVVTQVRELIKEQKRLQEDFSLCDQTEREHQIALASAINNSHDSERTYREKSKYVSLIAGLVGGIIALLGSSINNWHHRKDIKNFAHDINDQYFDIKNSVKKLNSIFSTSEDALQISQRELLQTTDLLSTIKMQHTVLDESIKSLQTLLNNKTVDFTPPNETFPIADLQEINRKYEADFGSKFKNYTYINLGALFFALILLYISKSN